MRNIVLSSCLPMLSFVYAVDACYTSCAGYTRTCTFIHHCTPLWLGTMMLAYHTVLTVYVPVYRCPKMLPRRCIEVQDLPLASARSPPPTIRC